MRSYGSVRGALTNDRPYRNSHNFSLELTGHFCMGEIV